MSNGNLRFRNEVLSQGFAQAYSWVICDKRFSDGALRLYLLLCWVARSDGMCFPGQDYLAKALKVNDRTIRVYLKELANVGLITISKRGQGRTNEYWIEDLNAVYGQIDNPMLPSDRALDVCWPVGSKGARQTKDTDDWRDKQAPEVDNQMAAAAEAMQAARERVQEERSKKAAKTTKSQTRTTLASRAAQAGFRPVVWEREWREQFENMFDAAPPAWDDRDRNKLRQLVVQYGEELVRRVIRDLFAHWDDRSARHGWELPTIGILYGWRTTLFTEAQTGRTFVGKRGRRAETREDEYREPTKTGSKDPGW